jgi:hypothetical protein
MKAVKKIIKIDTFSCKIEFIVSYDMVKDINNIYRKYNIDATFDGDAEGMLLTGNDGAYYLLIDPLYLTHNTIAHEIFHAVIRITNDRDITDEEACAWLTGYITEVVYKFLELKKINVKHGTR